MIVVCLANVRSGTTALARCFRGSESFVNLGEIFYNSDGLMGHYVKRWEAPNCPSIDRFEEYLEFLRSDPNHLYWIDIKFHDLSRFDPIQYGLLEPPKLLLKLIEYGDQALLLDRSNCLRGACSVLQATATGNFHSKGGVSGDGSQRKDCISRPDTIQAVRLSQIRKNQFLAVERFLLSHTNLFVSDYESMFHDVEGSDNRAFLGQWMGLEVVQEPDLRKISSDWPDWFDVDLARTILDGTGDHWWTA